MKKLLLTTALLTSVTFVGANAEEIAMKDSSDTNISATASKTTTTKNTYYDPNTGETTEVTFIQYDTNKDGNLDETEFVNYSYNVIDHDNDERISPDEWTYYQQVWYAPYEIKSSNNDFVTYDIDNDGYLEIVEYEKAYEPKLYAKWDVDGDGTVETVEYREAANKYQPIDVNHYYVW